MNQEGKWGDQHRPLRCHSTPAAGSPCHVPCMNIQSAAHQGHMGYLQEQLGGRVLTSTVRVLTTCKAG